VSSRREELEALRAERLRREAEAQQSDRRARRVRMAGGVGAVTVAGLAIVVLATGGGSDETEDPVPPKLEAAALSAARAAGCTLTSPPSAGHDHTNAAVRYDSNPPATGDHPPLAAADRSYDVAPDIGQLVHAAEHGRVVIWFRPSAPARVRSQLRTLFESDSTQLILVPNPTGMQYEVAATAWSGDRRRQAPERGHVLGCRTMTSKVGAALRAFTTAYRGRGPERSVAGSG